MYIYIYIYSNNSNDKSECIYIYIYMYIHTLLDYELSYIIYWNCYSKYYTVWTIIHNILEELQ